MVNGTKRLGDLVLENRGFFPESYWYWIGAAALLGFVLFFNLFFLGALTILGRKLFFLKLCPISCVPTVEFMN